MYICTGVRYVPLRTAGGKSTSYVGLFVKIGIKSLSHKFASASGICLQEPDALTRKFSPSSMLKTCNLSPVEGAADAELVTHRKEDNKEEMTCQLRPANISHTSLGRMLMQQNTNTCSVEIHVNPDAEDSDKDDYVGENAKL